MFANACEEARGYTRPVVLLSRLMGGQIGTGVGTFIVLNADGWMLTAAHILDGLMRWTNDAAVIAGYQQAKQDIESNSNISIGKKKHLVNQLPFDEKWVTHTQLLLGQPDGVSLQAQIDPIADLAIIKLNNINALGITNFPTLGNPDKPIQPGTSLCRMGFPFHTIDGVTFNEAQGIFNFPTIPPLAVFPNDGIFTREHIMIESTSGRQVRNIETSSPGLKGQSGGPIFDSQGRVWALQSKTLSLPLGISCKATDRGKEIVEHQFMHIGIGPHVKHIREFLDMHGVKYNSA
jgi:hypothetical protein